MRNDEYNHPCMGFFYAKKELPKFKLLVGKILPIRTKNNEKGKKCE